MIVDTHVHVLGADRVKYPRQLHTVIPPHFAWTRDDFTAEDLLGEMDSSGLHKALLVQAQNAYKSDNSYVADMAAQYPDRFKAVAVVDAREPDAADQLERWVKEHGVVGGRLMFQTAEFQANDPRVTPVMERARKLGIPMCIYVWWKDLAHFAELLARHPDQPIALDHMGLPTLSAGAPYSDAQPLFDLARYPNLTLKFSTSTLLAAARGSSTCRDWFSRLLTIFGPERLMWGTNYPMNHEAPVAGLLDMARRDLSFLSASEFEQLMGGNAARLYPSLA
jgi:L-fuconolactonase